MGWESRGNNRYYYASERVNGRVTKRYLGRCSWIPSMVWLDGHDRQERREEARREREARRQWREEDAGVKAFSWECGRLAELYLNAFGYFRHDRGAYRKRRSGMRVKAVDGMAEMDAIAAEGDHVPESREGRAAVVRAALSDRKQEALAIACIQKYPGELSSQCLSFVGPVIARCSGGQKVLAALMRSEVDAKRKALLGESPSPLERVLVERVLASQLHLSHVEQWYGNCWEKGGTIKQADSWERRLSNAQRLYLQAVKALAEVRKLQTPSLPPIALPGSTQVNIDKQLTIR